MRAKFEALPLVQALSQTGIVLPPVTSQPATVGVDLMASARTKIAVCWFFGLLLLSVVLMLAVRHSHYFEPPSMMVWLGFACLAGLCMLGWLWSEGATEPVRQIGPSTGEPQPGLRSTQLVLAAIVGVAAGLCAPSLPLAYSRLVQEPQEQVFELKKLNWELVPKQSTSVPSIQHLKGGEHWQALKEGDVVSLPIRRGAFGFWWQFDASALR